MTADNNITFSSSSSLSIISQATHNSAVIDVGGNLNMNTDGVVNSASQDLIITGSNLEADGDINLYAGRDIKL